MKHRYWAVPATLIVVMIVLSTVLYSQEDKPTPSIPAATVTPNEPGIPIDPKYPIEPAPAGELVEFHLAGPTTRGAEIEFAGHKIRLPDNAELDGMSMGELCIKDMECPVMPTLRILMPESGRLVILDSKMRMFEIIGRNEEGYDRYREQFRWLEDMLRADGANVRWVTRVEVIGDR